MPRENGKYVVPTGGWVNGAAPYINASEMNAISETLALLGVANGGTGANTAEGALANLGAEPIANVTNKGDSTTPVYFNSNGVAVPMATGTATINSQLYTGDIRKWGKLVMVTARTKDKSLEFSEESVIPDGYRPAMQTYGFAFGSYTTDAGADGWRRGIVSINKSGKIRVQSFDNSGEVLPFPAINLYYKFTLVYLTA